MKRSFNTSIAILLLILSLVSSISLATNPKFITGKLVKGNIDGCTWLIELKDKKILQPTNLNQFNFKLKNGKKIRFNYKALPKAAGFCMMGEMIEITEIKGK